MIAYLRGALFDFTDESIMIDINGMGFEVLTHSRSLSALPAKGSDILVYTFLQVLDNEFKLYGFLAKNELSLFKLLLGISGIGGRVALNILSAMNPEQFYYAVASRDEKSLTTIPGIGKKTAQRLIFELQGKIEQPLAAAAGSDAGNNTVSDVLEALEALGYSRSEVLPVVLELRDSSQLNNNVEEIIRQVLKSKAVRMSK